MKRFYALAGGGACLLFAAVWARIMRALSPREFEGAVLIVWTAMFISIFLLIRSWQRSAAADRNAQIASGVPAEVIDGEKCLRNVRSMKRLIVIFAVILAYGLLSTLGEPWLPRLVGSGFDLSVLALCFSSLMRSQRKLKSIQAQRSAEPLSGARIS